MATNHRPQVRGTDNAIWDRLRLVPFTTRFDDNPLTSRQVGANHSTSGCGRSCWPNSQAFWRRQSGVSCVAAAPQSRRTTGSVSSDRGVSLRDGHDTALHQRLVRRRGWRGGAILCPLRPLPPVGARQRERDVMSNRRFSGKLASGLHKVRKRAGMVFIRLRVKTSRTGRRAGLLAPKPQTTEHPAVIDEIGNCTCPVISERSEPRRIEQVRRRRGRGGQIFSPRTTS